MIKLKIKNTTLYKLPIKKNTYVCFRKNLSEESFKEIIISHKEKKIIFLG